MNNDGNTKVLELNNIAKDLRRQIFKMIYKAGGGHIGPSFSIVEILTALYFGGLMRYEASSPNMPERDRFILSKGHASAALYAVLARSNFFEKQLLNKYCQPGCILGGHPNMRQIPGVEASTGALGHGLLYAVGIAMAGKIDEQDYHVFTVLGDGECQEGSIWEAALFAAQHKLNNLTVIIDYNKLQAMDHLENIIKMEPFVDKWRAFGWDVTEVDGHDMEGLLRTLSKTKKSVGLPNLVIAHTIKGKGVSFMENMPLWHYRLPNTEEMKIVADELEFSLQEMDNL